MTNELYVFKITNIYKSDQWITSDKIIHDFNVMYGNNISQRSFQGGSDVYNKSRLLPKDWDDTTILAMML